MLPSVEDECWMSICQAMTNWLDATQSDRARTPTDIWIQVYRAKEYVQLKKWELSR